MNGIIYVSFCRWYSIECLKSIQSIRRHSSVPITIFSDECHENRFDGIEGVNLVPINKDMNPLKYKVKLLMDSPYDRTMFLDVDTVIVEPINELFDMLDNYEMCIAKNPNTDWSRGINRYKFLGYEGNDFNTGVMLYKKTEGFKKIYQAWFDIVMSQDDSKMRPGVPESEENCLNYIVLKQHPEFLENIGIFSNKVYNARGEMLDSMRADGSISSVKIYHSHDLVELEGKIFWKGEKWIG